MNNFSLKELENKNDRNDINETILLTKFSEYNSNISNKSKTIFTENNNNLNINDNNEFNKTVNVHLLPTLNNDEEINLDNFLENDTNTMNNMDIENKNEIITITPKINNKDISLNSNDNILNKSDKFHQILFEKFPKNVINDINNSNNDVIHDKNPIIVSSNQDTNTNSKTNANIDLKLVFKSLVKILFNYDNKLSASIESHTTTLLYFIINSLKLINIKNEIVNEEIKKQCLIFLSKAAVYNNANELIGFKGNTSTFSNKTNIELPHLASTYCAFNILLSFNISLFNKKEFDLIFNSSSISDCGDNTNSNTTSNFRFNYKAILEYIFIKLINKDGSISCINNSNKDNKDANSNNNSCIFNKKIDVYEENDSRYIYCALSIRKIINLMYNDYIINNKDITDYEYYFFNNTNSLTKSNLIYRYLLKNLNYQNSFSFNPDSEANAGVTYTTVSSIVLLQKEIPDKEKLLLWLLNRFNDKGVNGRTNKNNDSCYCFWVLATIKIMINYENTSNTANTGIPCINDLIDLRKCYYFIKKCNDNESFMFCKFIKSNYVKPDMLHTFYSLCSLSIIRNEVLNCKLEDGYEDNGNEDDEYKAFLDDIYLLRINKIDCLLVYPM